MKEKNKKILKGVGVGALALVGMVGLTGCANVKISQDKFDNLVEIAEKADDFMEEQNRLLEEANRMTKEEVWNLAQTADFNMMMNINGLRDNLVVTGVIEDLGLQQDVMYYYNSSDAKIFAELHGDEGVTNVELWYQKTESNVMWADIDKEGNEFVCKSVEDRGTEADFEYSVGVYRGGCNINGVGLTYEDFNHYEFLDNGNVKLTFVKNVEHKNPDNQEGYVITLEDYSFEYSLDGKLMSFKMASRIIEKKGEFENYIGMLEEYTYNYGYIFKYDLIDTELVESWVELAEAKRNEQ